MRVIQFRQRRLLTACALSGLGLIFLYLIFVSSQAGGESDRVHSRDFIKKKKDSVRAEKHISHPGEIPKYLGNNKRGNFEPQVPAVNDFVLRLTRTYFPQQQKQKFQDARENK